jgi:hypothetical protein
MPNTSNTKPPHTALVDDDEFPLIRTLESIVDIHPHVPVWTKLIEGYVATLPADSAERTTAIAELDFLKNSLDALTTSVGLDAEDPASAESLRKIIADLRK